MLGVYELLFFPFIFFVTGMINGYRQHDKVIRSPASNVWPVKKKDAVILSIFLIISIFCFQMGPALAVITIIGGLFAILFYIPYQLGGLLSWKIYQRKTLKQNSNANAQDGVQ